MNIIRVSPKDNAEDSTQSASGQIQELPLRLLRGQAVFFAWQSRLMHRQPMRNVTVHITQPRFLVLRARRTTNLFNQRLTHVRLPVATAAMRRQPTSRVSGEVCFVHFVHFRYGLSGDISKVTEIGMFNFVDGAVEPLHLGADASLFACLETFPQNLLPHHWWKDVAELVQFLKAFRNPSVHHCSGGSFRFWTMFWQRLLVGHCGMRTRIKAGVWRCHCGDCPRR